MDSGSADQFEKGGDEAGLGNIAPDEAAPPKRHAEIPGAPYGSLPIRYTQGGPYPVAVQGWKDIEYTIVSYRVDKNFEFTGKIPPELWRSVYAGLVSFASARNLATANIPIGLRNFMQANETTLSRPIMSTTCPPTPRP